MDDSMYNADELVPPNWMDGDFFEMVLKSAKPNEFQKVLHYTVGPATVRGDHYASVMFRGVVQYTDAAGVKQEISLICKTLPEVEGAKKDLLDGSTLFEVEIDMFRDVIPKFEQMLRSVGDNTRLCANMLYYSLSPRKIIVLEDITKIGFATVGKRMCTLEETRMALESLAKWHACSYLLNKQTEGSLEKYTNGVYNMPGIDGNVMFNKGTERMAQLARKTPKLQRFVDKLESIQDIVTPRCRNIYELSKKKCHINLLAHGDFHAKNLMFQFNPQTQLAESVILVDFQLSVWGSMALDLLYFIYMTVEGKIRHQYEDELIYEFFQKFLSTLKALGYTGKMPIFRDLQTDMLLLCRIELFLATTFLPFMIALVEQPNLDPDEIMTNEEMQMKLYESPAFIDEIEVVLKKFLHKGYFESIMEDDDDAEEN